MENIIFDFNEEYKIEVYHNNEWIKSEEYERIRSEKKDGNL